MHGPALCGVSSAPETLPAHESQLADGPVTGRRAAHAAGGSVWLWAKEIWIRILAQSLPCCVTLGKWLLLSERRRSELCFLGLALELCPPGRTFSGVLGHLSMPSIKGISSG